METDANVDDHHDHRDALLLRDAMDRTTDDLPALPDLAGPAVAQGRRRRARARLAVGGGVFAVAALGVAAGSLVLLPGGSDQGVVQPAAVPPNVTSTAPASPTPIPAQKPRTPVHIEPTAGEESMADLPAAERKRQEEFQNRAVGVLQDLLPAKAGEVRRTDLNVRRYQITQDAKDFTVIFSVRPSATDAQSPKPCIESKGMVCKKAALPGGIRALARTMPMDGTVTGTVVTFTYRKSDVQLSVYPDAASNTSAPVTSDDLLTVASSPRFLDLVRQADRAPMEEKQRTVDGG